MYTEFTAGNKTYKLELNNRAILQLERDLGYNPLQMFMDIDNDVLPKLGDMLRVLHRSMVTYNHGISYDDTADILDDYFKDGNTLWDLVPVLITVFQEAGFLPKEEDLDADSKN